jgi:hypothetical protein
MLRAVKDLSDIVSGDISIILLVDLAPSLVNPGLTGSAWLSSHGLQECIQVHKSIFLGVKVVEEDLSLSLGDGDPVVSQAEVELLLVQLPHTVMNKDVLEGLGETAEGANGLALQVVLHLCQNYLHLALDIWAC